VTRVDPHPDRPGHEPLGPGTDDGRPRLTLGTALIAVAVIVFVVFWVWALFFASKESINRIDDRAWAERAQGICASANVEREGLADYRRIDPDDTAMLRERGDLIDTSTDVVERMIDDVVAVAPGDAKGAEIVPRWEADYRVYIQNRRDYADLVRSGANEPFRQAETEGVPISERLTRFAVDNDMPACVAPRDL
jgi:hypothetical protein